MPPSNPVRTRPARRAPPALSRFSSDVFADVAKKTGYVDPALASAWQKIVGPEFAALCRPGRLTGGRGGRTLEIVCPNGAAAARCQFEAERIRDAANGWFGPGHVARIAVRQAGGAPPSVSRDSGLESALSRFRASFQSRRED